MNEARSLVGFIYLFNENATFRLTDRQSSSGYNNKTNYEHTHIITKVSNNNEKNNLPEVQNKAEVTLCILKHPRKTGIPKMHQ